MRFGLKSSHKQGAIKVTIPYTVAGSYTVKAAGKVVNQNEWDNDLKAPEPLSKKTCGENRFVSG
jgi:hypothetical protein